MYRPPAEKLPSFNGFESQLYKAKQLNLHIILLGDFNLDLYRSSVLLKWSTLYKSFDLEQIVQAPTRVTDKSRTLLDDIYIFHGINIKVVSVAPLSISDHFPTAITVKEAGRIENESHKVITYRKLKFVDYKVVISNIRKEFSCNKLRNVNSELANINEVIDRNYNKYNPIISKRVRSINKIPWITERVRKAMRIRDTYKILGYT